MNNIIKLNVRMHLSPMQDSSRSPPPPHPVIHGFMYVVWLVSLKWYPAKERKVID